MGHMKHHGVESFGQVGVLINTQFNRDPMNHTHQNITVGLPLAMRETLMQDIVGAHGQSMFTSGDNSQILCDASAVAYAPITKGKAAFAAACLISVEIKNSMVHCDWMFPTWMSPLASRKDASGQGYFGDYTIEAQVYSAVTGETITGQQLELIGLRNLTLFRCLNAAFMNYYTQKSSTPHKVNMRTEHDQPNPWMFETAASPVNVAAGTTSASWTYAAGTVPFAGAVSNQLMSQADIDQGLTWLYVNMFGWDATTGMPTAATLTKLGLGYVHTAIPSLIVA
jgi:aldehyde:ferredoxin oxidoreductase